MLKKILPKSEFNRHVITLMTGSSIAQAIPIAISPILSRLYTPEDFGLFALFMSVASIGSVIATARYELAIMLPKKDSDAINVVALSIIISVIMTIFSFLVVLIFNDQIVNLLGNNEISNWLYLIPVSILLTGTYRSFDYWCNRKKEYKTLSMNRVVKSGSSSMLNIGFAFNGSGGGGLISANLITQGISTFLLSKIIWKRDFTLLKYINKAKIIAMTKVHKKLPFFNLPNALLDIMRMSGIDIFISRFFSTAILGQYSLAWRTVLTPMNILGSSISQVLFQKIASTDRSKLNGLIKKFILRASLVSAPIFIFIYLFAEDLFSFVFGKNWVLAGEAASVLTPWLFLNFISSPLSMVYIVVNKQETLLIFAFFYALVPLAVLFIFKDMDFINVITILAFSMSAFLLMLILYILHLTSKYVKLN